MNFHNEDDDDDKSTDLELMDLNVNEFNIIDIPKNVNHSSDSMLNVTESNHDSLLETNSAQVLHDNKHTEQSVMKSCSTVIHNSTFSKSTQTSIVKDNEQLKIKFEEILQIKENLIFSLQLQLDEVKDLSSSAVIKKKKEEIKILKKRISNIVIENNVLKTKNTELNVLLMEANNKTTTLRNENFRYKQRIDKLKNEMQESQLLHNRGNENQKENAMLYNI